MIFDIETDGLLGALTEVHCIALQDRGGPIEGYGPGHLEKALDRLSAADVLVGHNVIAFDLPALRKVFESFRTRGRVVDSCATSVRSRSHTSTTRSSSRYRRRRPRKS